jgi:hypothetical protein
MSTVREGISGNKGFGAPEIFEVPDGEPGAEDGAYAGKEERD